MIQPTTRVEYDNEIRALLDKLFPPDVAARVARTQYPKSPEEAGRELRARRVWYPGDLPHGQVYEKRDMDMLVRVLHTYMLGLPVEPLHWNPEGTDDA